MKQYQITYILLGSLLIPGYAWGSLNENGDKKTNNQSIFRYFTWNSPVIEDYYPNKEQTPPLSPVESVATTPTNLHIDKKEERPVAPPIARDFVLLDTDENYIPQAEIKKLNELASATNQQNEFQIADLKNQLTTLQNLQLQTAEEKTHLADENANLMTTLRSLQSQLTDLTLEKSQSETTLRSLQSKNDDFQVTIANHATTLQVLQNQVSLLTFEKLDLMKQLQPLQLQITTLKRQNEALESEKAILTTKLTTLQPLAEKMQKLLPVELNHRIYYQFPTGNMARRMPKSVQFYVTEENFNTFNQNFSLYTTDTQWMIKKIDPVTGKILQ